MKSTLFYLLVCLSVIVIPRIGDAQEPKATDAASTVKKKKPDTFKVGGVFEAVTASEIKHDTEHLKSFVITRLVPHGTTVSKGQNIVWFKSEDLDKELRKAETELRLSKLTLDDDEFAYKQFQETQRLDREAAERGKRKAQQDYDNFVKVDRQRQLKAAEFSLKGSTASLANAMEELKQLEQMYKEDDLTEESEEIVLKRAKQSVESAEYRLAGTKIQTSRTINQTIPQSDAQQDATLSRARLTYQKLKRDIASARARREIEMSRKREQFKDEEQKMHERQQERKQIVLKALHDGIVFHGKLLRGKLSEKQSTLESGSKVTNDQTIATVAAPGRLRVRIDLSEDKLQTVVAGTKCKIRPKAFPEMALDATVKSVSPVPYAGTKYDCIVTFRSRKDIAVLPTMTCDVEFAVRPKVHDGEKQQ
ncbi:MAG: HlyD family efflux transporter periplasmic adaptor subunit [Fuerstiella sp.]